MNLETYILILSWLALVIYARLDITQFPNIIRENLY